MYKIKFTFAKNGDMVYISHLDLMRLFMRALRRAGLPVKISEGFNPHPKISITKALKLGVASDCLEAVFTLSEFVQSGDFRERLQKQLPCGIEINSVGKCVFSG